MALLGVAMAMGPTSLLELEETEECCAPVSGFRPNNRSAGHQVPGEWHPQSGDGAAGKH